MTAPAVKSSFTDQVRRVATKDDVEVKQWSGAKPGVGFRCGLCGHRFKIGDGWRWVYGRDRHFQDEDGRIFGVTNFFVCDPCDSHDVLDRWVALHIEFHQPKFWSFH